MFRCLPGHPCHIWCLCPGTSLAEVLHIVNLQSPARGEERRGPSHTAFHMMPPFPAPCLRLALRHLVPRPCPRPVVNGLTSPLNIFVMSGGVHHPDIPFMTEVLISQLLTYWPMKAYSWIPSQELAPDEGTGLTQRYLPSGEATSRDCSVEGYKGLSPLSLFGTAVKSFLESVETTVTASPCFTSSSARSCCFHSSAGVFPRAPPSELPASELHLRVCFTGNSIWDTALLPNLMFILQQLPGISHLLLSPLFGFVSLCLFFFPALFSFQWYFYKAAGINTCG